jgi:hypothetical protein
MRAIFPFCPDGDDDKEADKAADRRRFFFSFEFAAARLPPFASPFSHRQPLLCMLIHNNN